MSPVEIKVLLLRRGMSISKLARKFGCFREELSMCVRQVREYTHLRQHLADELGMPVERLFNRNKQARSKSNPSPESKSSAENPSPAVTTVESKV